MDVLNQIGSRMAADGAERVTITFTDRDNFEKFLADVAKHIPMKDMSGGYQRTSYAVMTTDGCDIWFTLETPMRTWKDIAEEMARKRALHRKANGLD